MNLLKNLRNIRHAVYKVYAVRGRTMRGFMSKLLAVGNRPALQTTVNLITYDGSGQACHPSVAAFHGNLYMTCTPYPYGEEFYENPSVYVHESCREKWKPVSSAFPIVFPENFSFEHYSDPCLFRRDGSLMLLFRKCERREAGKLDQLYISGSADGTEWASPKLLAEAKGDHLICPAVGHDARELFCVEIIDNENTRLVRYEFNTEDSLGARSVCAISGLEKEFFVWHIDVSYRGDGIIGLFMLQKRGTPITSKLAFFEYDPEENRWVWKQDVLMTDEENHVLKYVYKSAFTEQANRILCSACDKRNRYFLYEKSI